MAIAVKPHLRFDSFHRGKAYKSPKKPPVRSVPKHSDGKAHAQGLRQQVEDIQNDYAILSQSWEGREDIHAKGVVVEVDSIAGIEPHTERLLSHKWELLTQIERPGPENSRVTQQAWFVPDGALSAISDILSDYLTKTVKTKGGIQPKYRPFAESIERIGRATTAQLWTESDRAFPDGQTLWFEIWLRAGSTPHERQQILTQFRFLASQEGLRVGDGVIILPEHSIVACYGPASALSRNLALLNCIAEIRAGRDYADFFESLSTEEQAQFVRDLLSRTSLDETVATYVGILDTGVNRGHPALEPFVPEADTLTIKAEWGAADDDNHGTLMAGLCLYGNLAETLGISGPISIPVRVESAKIVPPPRARGTDEKLAGFYTAQGIAVAETKFPLRRRIWCLTTTMKGPNRPIPSSWSAALDMLAVGTDNDGSTRRLFCISAGNVAQEHWTRYPQVNWDNAIENPGQSWNALCVGACTDFDGIAPENSEYRAIAGRGCLAPSSSCSNSWDNQWPNKPDVVYEGGNAGFHEVTNSTLQLPEMLLLSTSADFRKSPLGTFCGTSAATAGVSRIAAQIAGRYSDFWPETVRGLIVHSAEWTEGMFRAVPPEYQGVDRTRFLLRTTGYGVPNLQKAIDSASNRTTLIAQCVLQPFKEENGEIVFNEMHVHEVPWPTRELQTHALESVRLRVTLSYFIEPNPGNRGYTSTFRYPGCQLRFRVSSPGQKVNDLEAQVSKLAAEDMKRQHGTSPVKGTSEGWRIGTQTLRGSIHSDVWEGSCADLVSMKYIAVFPVTGWWRTRLSQNKVNERIHYALIATIESQNPEVNVYTEIETAIAASIGINTE